VEKLDRQHCDNRAVVFNSNLGQRLEAPQLESSRRAADHGCRFGKLLSRFVLAFRLDDACALRLTLVVRR